MILPRSRKSPTIQPLLQKLFQVDVIGAPHSVKVQLLEHEVSRKHQAFASFDAAAEKS
jgi:hypothetical protein